MSMKRKRALATIAQGNGIIVALGKRTIKVFSVHCHRIYEVPDFPVWASPPQQILRSTSTSASACAILYNYDHNECHMSRGCIRIRKMATCHASQRPHSSRFGGHKPLKFVKFVKLAENWLKKCKNYLFFSFLTFGVTAIVNIC